MIIFFFSSASVSEKEFFLKKVDFFLKIFYTRKKVFLEGRNVFARESLQCSVSLAFLEWDSQRGF